MGIDGKRSKPIIEKAAALENLLVLRQFREAERASLELLRGSAYLSNSQTIQQRAAHVYVQAMYEQQRCAPRAAGHYHFCELRRR